MCLRESIIKQIVFFFRSGIILSSKLTCENRDRRYELPYKYWVKHCLEVQSVERTQIWNSPCRIKIKKKKKNKKVFKGYLFFTCWNQGRVTLPGEQTHISLFFILCLF